MTDSTTTTESLQGVATGETFSLDPSLPVHVQQDPADNLAQQDQKDQRDQRDQKDQNVIPSVPTENGLEAETAPMATEATEKVESPHQAGTKYRKKRKYKTLYFGDHDWNYSGKYLC